MAVLEPYKGSYYLWTYLPSQPASILFLSLFLIATVLNAWALFRRRSWFCIPFAIGCFCKLPSLYTSTSDSDSNTTQGEIVGFAARAVAYNRTSDLGIFVIQATFLVIAPAFYAASIYMTLSRIIRCVKGEHLSIIRVKWLTRIFVLGDVLSLTVQSGGAGLTQPSVAKFGEKLIIVGLFIQLVLLGLFFATAIVFDKRLKERPTSESYTTDSPWRQTLNMIYAVSALIFARSIFRVVEYIQGHDGYPLTHEWTLYVFDGVLMLVVAFAFWFWYPGYIRPAKEDSDTVELGNNRDSSG